MPLIFTATYNEADNLPALVNEVFQAVPECHLLVVDDASPDGTGRLLDRLIKSEPRLRVIHRSGKLGLGTAHELAMRYAIHHGYPFLVTMDADFSHHPKYLPTLLEKLRDHDFVIGSRYVPGGSCDYRSWRRALSESANTMTRLALGLGLRETTTAFRGYRLELLKRMPIDQIRSEGYSFFVESLWTIHRLNAKMTEFPIHFEDRRAGTSKINKKEILKGMATLLRLTWGRVRGQTLPAVSPMQALPCNCCGSQFMTEIYPSTSLQPSYSLGPDSSSCQNLVANHDSRIASQKSAASFSVYHCTNTMHHSHGRIARCLVCGLVQTSPRPDPGLLLEKYTEVEDPVYVQNLTARVETYKENWQSIASYLPPTGRILDLGSYCGVFLNFARERGYDAMGVEPSRWASAYSREHFGVSVHTGTLSNLDGEVGEFDVLTAWDVLEHMDSPQQELHQVASRLKAGGIFAFCTLDVRNWLPRLLGERWPWLMDMHLYYFDDRTLRLMLGQAGLEVLHRQPYCHIITLDYFLYKLDSLGVPGALWTRRLLGGSRISRLRLPFRFGDIQLYVCRKSGVAAAAEVPLLQRAPTSTEPLLTS